MKQMVSNMQVKATAYLVNYFIVGCKIGRGGQYMPGKRIINKPRLVRHQKNGAEMKYQLENKK